MSVKEKSVHVIEKVLPELLCEDIIDKFESVTNSTQSVEINKRIFVIPKKDKDWQKIECLIYKELLVNINKYKDFLINRMTEHDVVLINKFNSDMFVKEFTIEKCVTKNTFKRNNNRYNILSFILILNKISFKTANISIQSYNQGDLVLVTDTNLEDNTIDIFPDQIIIVGQVCSNNVTG
jgi:hypothetical protein